MLSLLKKNIDRLNGKSFNLDFPDQKTIKRTFLEMPEYGRVIISTRFSSLVSVLSDLECAGFVGMRMILISSPNPVVRLVAYKGAGGSWYDTERTDQYKGGALAALDDDRHLLFGTRALFVPGKLDRSDGLKSGPVEYDPGALDGQAEILASCLGQRKHERSRSDESISAVLYPGPFRMLILEDGSMLSRGRVTLIQRPAARRLKKTDKCILFNAGDAVGAEKPRQFSEAYKAGGILSLLENIPGENHLRGSCDQNLGELDRLPAETRKKLETLISRHDKYFVLTGSDPWDEYGCCPSREVGAANRLVEAGILTVLSSASAPGACPTAIYAFNGEIGNAENTPQFTINKAVRNRVLDYMKAIKKGPYAIVSSVIKWILLFFVAAALAYVVINPSENASMHSAFSGLNGDGVLIYYFHPAARCAACLKMEAFTEKTLRLYYDEEMLAGSIALVRVNIDDTANLKLVEEYGIFNTTIVMVKQTRGKVTHQKILFEQIWELFDSEYEFISMLSGELRVFLEKSDE